MTNALHPALAVHSIPPSLAAHSEEIPDKSTASDAFLVEEVKKGNATAFEQLMERHSRWCFFKAYSILRNRGDAEEEVQNSFTKAWKHLEQFQGDGPFAGWLNRIVANQCMMRIREQRRARMVSVDQVFEWDGSFRMEVVDQRALPEDTLGETQVSRVLQREIRCIPPLLREPLIMRDVQHLSLSHVAEVLGISVPAAKSRLMRARQELKVRLAKHGGEKGLATLLRNSPMRRTANVRVS